MASKSKRIDEPTLTAAEAPNPTLDAMALTALAKMAKPDDQRNLLKPGFYPIDLTVSGTVDGMEWYRELQGTLTVGMDSAPVAASSTPWADLLHSALSSLSAKDRQAWLAKLATGEIPPAACGPDKAAAVKAEMEPALKAYRQTKAAPKRGNVAYVPTPPPKP